MNFNTSLPRLAYSKERANQSLDTNREKENPPFLGGDTHASLRPGKTEITEKQNILVTLMFGIWGERGVGRGKHLSCPLRLAENHTAKHLNQYLIKVQVERAQNRLAASISCEWSVPCFIKLWHASLLMPLSRVGCKAGGLVPLYSTFSAKDLQIPGKLLLWILYGSRMISKSSLKFNTKSLRLYSVPAAFSKRVDPHQRRK